MFKDVCCYMKVKHKFRVIFMLSCILTISQFTHDFTNFVFCKFCLLIYINHLTFQGINKVER